MKDTTMNTEMIEMIIDRWAERTASLSDESPHVPVGVLLGEAIDVAEVLGAYSSESEGGAVPGLASFYSEGALTRDTSTELRELQLAAATIDSRYGNLVQKERGTTMEDAQVVIRELRFALSFVLESGNNPAGEEQLERLRSRENENQSQDGIALVLDNYRELAREYLEHLEKLPDFDPGIIDTAIATAQGLRQRSADALTGKTARKEQELLTLRNRLLAGISDRVREVRRVVRYVFRDHPDIVQKATSKYARNSRRRTRAGNDVSEVAKAESPDAFDDTQVPAGTVG